MQKELFDTVEVGIEKDADFSPCRTYRYALRRVWVPARPKLLYVMLNPSTADENADDQTVNNCVEHGRRFGFGHIAIVNLFAVRSSDQSILDQGGDVIGPENDQHIESEARTADQVVVAWGNGGVRKNRDVDVMELLLGIVDLVYCFGKNKATKKRPLGNPLHPCYLHGKARKDEFTIFSNRG